MAAIKKADLELVKRAEKLRETLGISRGTMVAHYMPSIHATSFSNWLHKRYGLREDARVALSNAAQAMENDISKRLKEAETIPLVAPKSTKGREGLKSVTIWFDQGGSIVEVVRG